MDSACVEGILHFVAVITHIRADSSQGIGTADYGGRSRITYDQCPLLVSISGWWCCRGFVLRL